MIIIPDIHGRSFWHGIVAAYPDEQFLFLGDYIDPYPWEGLKPTDGIEQLERVIALKRSNPSRVILLLGNHDLAYIYPSTIKASRHNSFYEDTIQQIFVDNLECFQMAYAKQIAGKEYVFSHAGFHPAWVESHASVFNKANSYSTLVSLCNELLRGEDISFICSLADISASRYGSSASGSMIWADEEEYVGIPLPKHVYQVFGHTQQDESAIITSYYACLDCRMGFQLNEETGEWKAIENSSHKIDWDEIDNVLADLLKPQKFIFLDFDGVMDTYYYNNELTRLHRATHDEYGPIFDPECIQNLQYIIDKTGAKIVVSSSWKQEMGLDEIQRMWKERELPGVVIDTTPDLPGDRGDEIKAWIDAYPAPCQYVIIDDMDAKAFLPKQIPQLVLVNSYSGLDPDCAERAISILQA